MEKPKVSIIVPIYNSEKYLSRCIESLIHQTFHQIEIILVNDGSKDKSGEICRMYGQKDERIVYIEQKNAGVSAARNHGLDTATAEYVMFCDSDDYYDETAVAVLLKSAQLNQADWVLGAVKKNIKGNIEIVNPGDFVAKDQQERIVEIIKLTDNYMIYQLWGKLFRRSIIEKFKLRMRKEMSCGEDFEWICRFVSHAKCIVGQSVIAYFYCVEDNQSLSQKFIANHYQNIEISYRSAVAMYEAQGVSCEGMHKLMRQQINRIWSTMSLITKKDCNLTFLQKVVFIHNCRDIPSFVECIKQKKVDGGKKQVIMRLSGDVVLTLIIVACATIGSMKSCKTIV